MRTNKTEQGRSMVEMLGVLAVVGVLSIGALGAYSYGMNKYRTNELLEGASRRAYTVASQVMLGRNPSLAEFEKDNKTAGGEFQPTVNMAIAKEFGIQVNGVNKAVCENLVKMATESSVISAIAKAGAPDTAITESDCADSNNLLMMYHENMGNSSDETTVTCKEEEKRIKFYVTGDCCDQLASDRFCPTENPPKCVVSESKLSQCKTDCSSDGYNWDSINNICCVDSGGITDECCKMDGGAGLNNDGQCCDAYIDANGECCADRVDPDGNCCEIADNSEYCCAYWDGTWNGSSCDF